MASARTVPSGFAVARSRAMRRPRASRAAYPGKENLASRRGDGDRRRGGACRSNLGFREAGLRGSLCENLRDGRRERDARAPRERARRAGRPRLAEHSQRRFVALLGRRPRCGERDDHREPGEQRQRQRCEGGKQQALPRCPGGGPGEQRASKAPPLPGVAKARRVLPRLLPKCAEDRPQWARNSGMGLSLSMRRVTPPKRVSTKRGRPKPPITIQSNRPLEASPRMTPDALSA